LKRPKGEARREEILAVTCEVLRDRGFARIRMSDIANRLDISPPLVVYHFGSKDALLGEAFAYASRAEIEDIDAIAESDDSPVSRLDALLVAGVGPSTRASWAMWIDSWGEAVRSPVLRKTWRQLDDRWRAALESVVRDGMEQGAFREGDPAEDAAVIAVLIDGLGVQVALTSAKKAIFLDQARRVTDTLLDVNPDKVNAERARR
jgi:AcrR family transcriptional regulator